MGFFLIILSHFTLLFVYVPAYMHLAVAPQHMAMHMLSSAAGYLRSLFGVRYAINEAVDKWRKRFLLCVGRPVF